MSWFNDAAWYWQALMLTVWLVVTFGVFFVSIVVHRAWVLALSGILFLGPLVGLVVWDRADGDAPRQRCEAAGGVWVKGQVCIDKSAVIPESEYR